MSIRRLNTQQPDFAAKFSELVAVDSSVDPEITRRAEAIVQDVRARGDEAVLEYTNRFDHMDAKSVAEFRLTEEDLKEALETLPKDQKDALTQAAQRIREFHEHELGQSWSITEEDGTKLGIRYIPLDSVGLYVQAVNGFLQQYRFVFKFHLRLLSGFPRGISLVNNNISNTLI